MGFNLYAYSGKRLTEEILPAFFVANMYYCLQWVPTSLKKVDDSSWRTFLRRLVDFYKPTNKIFARLELVKGQPYAQIGCYLMEFLADESQVIIKVFMP